MAVNFSNAIRTDVYLGVFITNAKESCFSSFLSYFKQYVLGLFGLLGLNAVIIMTYCNTIIVWSLEIFSSVSQAFISMLANRGTVLVRGCIGFAKKSWPN